MRKDGFRPSGKKVIEISENGKHMEEFSSLHQASKKNSFLNPASISYAMKHPPKIKILTGEAIDAGVYVNRETNKIFFVRPGLDFFKNFENIGVT